MKVYFEGEKNTLFFRPLPERKKGRSKKLTNEQWLKNMGTKALAHELALVAEWDREQLGKAKKRRGGLDAFMEKWLQSPAEDCYGA